MIAEVVVGIVLWHALDHLREWWRSRKYPLVPLPPSDLVFKDAAAVRFSPME